MLQLSYESRLVKKQPKPRKVLPIPRPRRKVVYTTREIHTFIMLVTLLAAALVIALCLPTPDPSPW